NLLGPEVPVPAKPSVTPASPSPRTPSGWSAPPSPPPAAAGTPAVRPPLAPNSGIPAAAGSASPDSLRLSPPTTAFPSRARALPAADEADQDVDPLTRMTLMDFTF